MIGKRMKINRFHKEYIIKITDIKTICNGVYSVSGISEENKKFTLTCLHKDILDNLV